MKIKLTFKMYWEDVKHKFRKSWKTSLLSCLFFTGATYFLVWSELNTIKSILTVDEALSLAQSIDINSMDDTSQYEGRVIHVVGPLEIEEPISEPDYNLQVRSVKLRRRVQMYQWIEETSDEPGDESQKRYWYHKDWRDYVVDSFQFYLRGDHHNPKSIPLQSVTHLAKSVKIGWLPIGTELKRLVSDYHEVWSDARPARPDVRMHAGFYYHGASALEHAVGDLRVRFMYAGRQDDTYSALGVVRDGALETYVSPRHPLWEPVGLLHRGAASAPELAALARAQRSRRAWHYRLVGLAQVYAALMTLHPDWLAMLLECSWVSNHLRDCPSAWAWFIISNFYTLFLLSLPWLWYNPLVGVSLLCLDVVILARYTALLWRDPPPARRPHYQ